MANPEILQLRGRLAAAKEMAETLKIGIEIDRSAARVVLDPFLEPQRLEVDELEIVTKRLVDQVRKYREQLALVGKVSAALGMGD